jgi:DMATS type aromatic prenyltransferase
MKQTLGFLGRRQLAAICKALGSSREALANDVFDVMCESWAHRSVDEPSRVSDITDDHSPFEFSLAFDRKEPKLRLLVEAQGEHDDLESNWNAAWHLNERLESRFGASLERARAIRDLFQPEVPGLRFGLWHAVSVDREQPPFKAYFNPQAKGPHRANEIVAEALNRLGFSKAWQWLRSILSNSEQNRLIYFSLDLLDESSARVKVYVAHHAVNASTVESLMALGPGHEPGDAAGFCAALTGSIGPYSERPAITCMAFVAGHDEEPSSITLHVPVRSYVPHDAAAVHRIAHFLSPVDGQLFERCVKAIARRPLDAWSGLPTYASYRREEGSRRLTVYLSPEAYRARGHV